MLCWNNGSNPSGATSFIILCEGGLFVRIVHPYFITFAVSGANLYSAKWLPSATSFNDDFRYGQL